VAHAQPSPRLHPCATRGRAVPSAGRDDIPGDMCLRRFQGKKEKLPRPVSGRAHCHEMNRCIHMLPVLPFLPGTMRVSGTLGPCRSRAVSIFGRFRDGSLESPFSGKPGGHLSNRCVHGQAGRFKAGDGTSRHSIRLQSTAPSGATPWPMPRYREVIRVEARFNEKVTAISSAIRAASGFRTPTRTSGQRAARVGMTDSP